LTSLPRPDFEDPDLARMVEALPEPEVDALPFGAVRLDKAGVVQIYSQAERDLSGSGDHQRIGLDFFAQIAPCMDTPGFRGRIERARAAGQLDLEFGFVGDFADRERELTVRVQPASDGGLWIFMRRED
jgi:photoactive yellow protein